MALSPVVPRFHRRLWLLLAMSGIGATCAPDTAPSKYGSQRASRANTARIGARLRRTFSLASLTSPAVNVGGGSIFGPQPRDYSNSLPSGMHRLARKSALSAKAREGQIRIVEDFTFAAPKTREMAALLAALGLDGTKTLLLTPASDGNVVRSGRNLPRLAVMVADKASTYDFLNNGMLLIQKSAVEVLENTFKNTIDGTRP